MVLRIESGLTTYKAGMLPKHCIRFLVQIICIFKYFLILLITLLYIAFDTSENSCSLLVIVTLSKSFHLFIF